MYGPHDSERAVDRQWRCRSDYPGELILSITFTSIGVELPFDADANGNAVVDLEWRRRLSLWRTPEAFYGSAMLLDLGTPYDLRATVSNPDGVVGEPIGLASIATPADDIAPASALQPTHFVVVGGNNAGDGLRPEAAWATIDKAFHDAPARAVVRIGPGSFAPPSIDRELPITLAAELPAVDDARQSINAGRRTVIERRTLAPGSRHRLRNRL